MKRLAQITAVVLITVIGALAVWQMREAVQLLLVALAAASGVEPWVQRLQGRRLGRPASVALAYVAALATVLVAALFFGALASAEITTVVDRLPVWYDQARQALQASGGWAAGIGGSLPTAERLTSTIAGQQQGDVIGLALGFVSQALTLVTLAISAATLGFYWLLERQRIERLWLSLLPLDVRTTARGVWQQVYDEVGIYVRGEATLVVLSAVSLLSVYTVLGVPGAGVLAVLGGLAQVVPLLGTLLAVVPGVAVALTQGPTTAGLTLVGALYVLTVIQAVIAPRVFRAGVTVNPVLVMFLIIVLADLGGLWMILLAPPLAAAIQASVRVLSSDMRAASVSERQHAAALQARLEAVEQEITRRDVVDPRLTGLLTRARRLVEDASQNLPDPPPEGVLPSDAPGVRPA